jgi:hypothetical protein
MVHFADLLLLEANRQDKAEPTHTDTARRSS